MWTYKRQIKIRWISFFLGIAFILGLFLYFKAPSLSLLTAQGVKNARINLSVFVTALPIWAMALICVGFIVAALIGVPTPLIFAILLMHFDFYKAFALALFCQILVSGFAIRISKRYKNNGVFDDKLVTELTKINEHALSFMFWARVYSLFPLRTIDLMTPYLFQKPIKLYKIASAVSLALFFRMIVPFNLIFAALKLNGCFVGSLPSLWHNFIFWSITMLVYVIIPRAPEIIICPNVLKKALFTLVPYSIFVPRKKVAKKSKKKATKAGEKPEDDELAEEAAEQEDEAEEEENKPTEGETRGAED